MKRPKLLYLVHRMPFPPDKGDRIRAYHLLRFLVQHADVYLACLADEPVKPEAVAALESLCARVAVVEVGRTRWLRAGWSLLRGRSVSEGAFSSPALRRVLRDWAINMNFQAVLASASSMVPYLRMAELQHIPAVVDLVDVDSQKWLDYASQGWGPRSWLHRMEGGRLRTLERSLPSWARAVTLVSEAEADLYRRFCSPGNVRAVYNGVDLKYFQPRPEVIVEPACVFVGALDYYPNIDAACWFSREVWPTIHRRHPEAQLLLVGRNPAPAVRQLAELPGVDLVGQVPDVRPFLARATAAIVPLRIARGLQNKVLEALAMGKAVVASPQALAALKTQSDVHLLSATSPEQWAEAISRLFADEGLRRQLGNAGRQFVEEEHNWETCLAPLTEILGLTVHPPLAGAAVDMRLDLVNPHLRSTPC